MSAPRQASRLARHRVARCCGVVLGLLASAPFPASAQTVYRCGPAGNSYSHQPCPEGRVVDVNDPRSPAQVKEARDSLREQERWATRAARERRAEEAAHPPALAAGIGPAPAARTPAERSVRADAPRAKGASPKRLKPARDGEFVAIAPGSTKTPRGQR